MYFQIDSEIFLTCTRVTIISMYIAKASYELFSGHFQNHLEIFYPFPTVYLWSLFLFHFPLVFSKTLLQSLGWGGTSKESQDLDSGLRLCFRGRSTFPGLEPVILMSFTFVPKPSCLWPQSQDDVPYSRGIEPYVQSVFCHVTQWQVLGIRM